eukprot:4865209-Lingulodinium_polyedra.AAC.1
MTPRDKNCRDSFGPPPPPLPPARALLHHHINCFPMPSAQVCACRCISVLERTRLNVRMLVGMDAGATYAITPQACARSHNVVHAQS